MNERMSKSARAAASSAAADAGSKAGTPVADKRTPTPAVDAELCRCFGGVSAEALAAGCAGVVVALA